jgi:translation initiation factor eIF-2B subunit gamma
VLLPVDFIPPPSLSLLKILNKFRNDTTSDGAIATTCWFEPHRSDKSAVVEEWGSFARTVPIAWEEKTMTLLYIDPAGGVDGQSEDIDLRMGLLMEWVDVAFKSSTLPLNL